MYTTKKYKFGPHDTIRAIIKKLNKNENMSQEQLDLLVEKFNELNHFIVPRLGKEVKIPILKEKE